MSTVCKSHWTNQLTPFFATCLRPLIKANDVKILLQNRGYKGSLETNNVDHLLEILKTHYKIEDENLCPFEELDRKQLVPELRIRHLEYNKDMTKQQMIDKLNVNRFPEEIKKLPNIDKLVIYSFVEYYGHLFDLYIPHYLKEIILKYGKSKEIKSFCLLNNYPEYHYLYTTVINGNKKKLKHQKLKIHTLTANYLTPEVWDYRHLYLNGDVIRRNKRVNTGFNHVFKSHFTLTANMKKDILKSKYIKKLLPYFHHNNYINSPFHAIFEVNAISNYIYLIPELYDDNQQNGVLRYKFPQIYDDPASEQKISYSLYDDEIGLMTYLYSKTHENGLYHLSFQSKNYQNHEYVDPEPNYQSKWKWNKITNKKLGNNHSNAIIINYNNKKKLFVSGTKKSMVYDFETNKNDEIDCPHLNLPGLYYEPQKKCVYAAECWAFKSYDLHKNKWTNLPSTYLGHSDKPSIWSYEYNNNILCIASFGPYQGMEWIDIRENKNWNVSYLKTPGHSMCELFGFEYKMNEIDKGIIYCCPV